MRGAGRSEFERDARILVLGLLLGGTFAIRVSLSDPGPVELAPIILGTFWFGLTGARAAAVIACALLGTATIIHPHLSEISLAWRIPMFLATAEALGRLKALSVTQARELSLLRSVQDALAPSVAPRSELLDIATRYVPAEGELAGDFYLIAEGHNNSTIVVVGDVVGKGMAAAKRAAFIRATMNASAAYTDDPVHLLRTTNAELVRQYGVSTELITMLCVVVHPDGSVAWASAGHPAPVSLADGRPLGDPPPCYPLGIAPELTGASVVRLRLPQAGMLLYTDGLVDARPPGGSFEPLGEHRIGLFLRELRDPSLQQAVDHLVASARAFAGGVLPDDVCLVALRSKLPRRLPSPHDQTGTQAADSSTVGARSAAPEVR